MAGIYTGEARNLMLAALVGTNPTTPITYVGIYRADAGKTFTGVASTDIITCTAHGYSNGDFVLLSGITGGGDRAPRPAAERAASSTAAATT